MRIRLTDGEKAHRAQRIAVAIVINSFHLDKKIEALREKNARPHNKLLMK